MPGAPVTLEWEVSGEATRRRHPFEDPFEHGRVRVRARRLLREVFRLHQLELTQPLDLVLVARPSIVGKRFAEVEHDFLAALRQGKLLKE